MEDSLLKKTGDGAALKLHYSIRRVESFPYAIFVRSSSMYRTSRQPQPPHIRKAVLKGRRPVQTLPFRPDPYPYADRRWSKRLGPGKKPEGETGLK